VISERERLRELVGITASALMEAEVESVAGASYHVPSPSRRAQRNGYRASSWRTPLGPIPLDIPKLRRGSYRPHWLREADATLIPAVAEAYAQRRVSTAWLADLTRALGLSGLTRDQLDELIAALREEIAA
jgi:transposase-like protein